MFMYKVIDVDVKMNKRKQLHKFVVKIELCKGRFEKLHVLHVSSLLGGSLKKIYEALNYSVCGFFNGIILPDHKQYFV
jgi:hypothetical protein